MQWFGIALLFLFLVLAHLGTSREAAAQKAGFEGHTPPNFWAEPRIFHRPFKPEEERLVTHARLPFEGPPPEDRVVSPNKAYWYALSDREDTWQEITVYSERNEVTVIAVRRTGQRNAPKLTWINEKLLYGEIWHGRISGEVFLLDAETGRVLLHEKAVYGQIHFQQWQQGCQTFPDTPSCQKPKGLP
jgi:hypothetical protein